MKLVLYFRDGQMVVPSDVRNVTSDKYTSEYYAIYRPQYYLEVKSEVGNTDGSGWYNPSTNAEFSVSPLAGIWNLKSFDHWIGDVSGQTGIDVPLDLSI